MEQQFQLYTQQLIAAGNSLYQQGLVPATSGNFSARLDNGELAITVSGRHKGKLQPADIMRTDANGVSLDERKPSAETLLHVQIYRQMPHIRAILHPHSVNATIVSRLQNEPLHWTGYELLKAFAGIQSHEAVVEVPIFANSQDIPCLAQQVDSYMQHNGSIYGYLIAGHGLYTWGESVDEALRHVEAFEFLLQCELEMRRLQR